MDKYGLAIYNENRVKKRLSTYLDCWWISFGYIPDNEAPRQVKFEKNQCLCGFREFPNRINLPLYTKFTPIGAKNGAETKKSHNFEFHTAPEKLHLLRSFFHFS